jgi:hypothetical protein
MARFDSELPTELLKVFDELETNCEEIFGNMTKAGAEVVYKNVKSNMAKSFKSTKALDKGLKITKVYKTPSDDGINVYVGFYGYDPDSKPTKKHPYGTPIPLIALAREYGTSRGEQKKPFLRKSFNKSQIEQEMLKVQNKYIKGD